MLKCLQKTCHFIFLFSNLFISILPLQGSRPKHTRRTKKSSISSLHINVSKPTDLESLQQSCKSCVTAKPCSPLAIRTGGGGVRLCQRCSIVLPACFCKVQPHTKKSHASQSRLFPMSSLLGTRQILCSGAARSSRFWMLGGGVGGAGADLQMRCEEHLSRPHELHSCVDREEGGGEKGCVPPGRDKTATRRLSSDQHSKRSKAAATARTPELPAQQLAERADSWAAVGPAALSGSGRRLPRSRAPSPLLARRGAPGHPRTHTVPGCLPALLGGGLPPAGTAGRACSPGPAGERTQPWEQSRGRRKIVESPHGLSWT